MLALVEARVRNARRAVGALGGQGKWAYLGRDHRVARSWEKRLGPAWVRVSYGERLQELARAWRKPYAEWAATCVAPDAEDDVVWFSEIAERNTLQTTLFHKSLYVECGKQLIRECDGPLLLVAESPAVLRTLHDDPAVSVGVVVRSLSWGPAAVAPRELRRAARWARYAARALGGIAAARATRGRSPKRSPNQDSVILLRTFADETYFGADGIPQDRYFGVLPRLLESRGHSVAIVPVLQNLRRSPHRAYLWLRAHAPNALIPEDFLTWGDHVWAAKEAWRVGRLPRHLPPFNGIDLRHLEREMRAENRETAAYVARWLRDLRLARRFRERGLRIRAFLDTYERLATEKPLLLGIQREFPDAATVGFHFVLAPPPLLLHFFTTADESRREPMPERIICSSTFTRDLLAQEGFPAERLTVGPALRYLHLLQTDPGARRPEAGRVLVVLPAEVSAASELLDKLTAAFPPGTAAGLTFHIKPHPFLTPRQLASILPTGGFPEGMALVGGAMSEQLAKAACAVIAASTSALEVALAGVPLVVVGRETDLDIDPLAWFADGPKPVREEKGIEAAVRAAVTEDASRQAATWAAKNIGDCVEPLSDSGIELFAGG